jgi:UDP-2,3-diacylglucosamine hydrolase
VPAPAGRFSLTAPDTSPPIGGGSLPKLAILAGGGPMPAMLARAARETGREVFVVAFTGQSDPTGVEEFPHMWTRFGAAGGIIERLKAEGVGDIVFIGPVRRPSLGELMPDWWGARFLARVGMKALGDDGLLRAVAAALEEEGFRVRALGDVMGGLATPEGVLGRHRPDEQAEADIARGIAVARGLGALDVGQGAVVQQGIVLAVEAIEGTDAMLARSLALVRPGPGGVLVKTAKPQQDRRLDLPTIGTDTVVRAHRAGLRGIAVEAGASLIVDQAATVAEADRLGLFVVGVTVAR